MTVTRPMFAGGARLRGTQVADIRHPELSGVLHENDHKRDPEDMDLLGHLVIPGVAYFIRGCYRPNERAVAT